MKWLADIDYKPLVTIIIPSYNSEKTISRVIDSVLAQTYQNWELIIVDDGSSDASPQILDQYAKENHRITVIHQIRLGVSEARNSGIDLAQGEYLVFADADDELTCESIEIRVSLIAGAEFGIANYINIPPTVFLPCNEYRWSKNKTIENIITGKDWGYQGYLWNKIFLMKIINENEIRFIRGIAYNEDRLFCFTYAQYINVTNISNEVVYKYIQSNQSVMNKLKSITDDEFGNVLSEFRAFEAMKKINGNYKTDIRWQEYYRAFMLRDIIGEKETKLQRAFARIIRKTGIILLFSPGLKMIKRLVLFRNTILLKQGYIV